MIETIDLIALVLIGAFWVGLVIYVLWRLW